MLCSVRADQLKIGQETCYGQRVLDISYSGSLVNITWQQSSKRKVTIQYFPEQRFDMRTGGDQEKGAPDMAQKVNIIVESDLSGKPDAETVSFGLDGANYEIDLTTQEQEKMRETFAKYVGAGRKVTGSRRRASSPAAPQSGPSAKVIREWAQENGHEVPDRGRIPAEVREAYNAAH